MNTIIRAIGIAVACAAIAGCGSSSDQSVSDDGRLLTGTLDSAAAAMVIKAADGSADCVGDVCGVIALGSDGSQVQGEILPAENRWRVRVRAGNWMFGFLDGNGNRLGTMALSGITALTIDEGDDVDLGQMRLMNGYVFSEEEVAGLGFLGVRSYHGQDADHDGIPNAFGDDEPLIDPSVFAVLQVKPFDGQPHVAPCRPLKIEFTQTPDQATLTADTIQVSLAADGSVVAGTISYEEDLVDGEYNVKFAPIGGWEMGAVVNVLVVSGDAGVLSATGEPLAADVATSFTVRAFGGTSMTCHEPDDEYQQLQLRQREQAREGSGDGSGDGSGEGGNGQGGSGGNGNAG